MDLHLTGKAAIVTGASRGIGLAITRTLLDEGMRVFAAARTITPELAATEAVTMSVDLATADGPERLVAQAKVDLGELDLLVNNVGGGAGTGQTGGFLSFSDQQWRDAFELNFHAAVRTTRAALESLIAQRGAIVNISSNGARMPHAGPVVYTTAKAALTAFGKALAAEFGPRGVRVNTVSPGAVLTDLWQGPASYGAELAASLGVDQEQLIAGLPGQLDMVTGRLVTPEEVGALVAYLASPLAGSIVGADHLIDAGATKTV